METLYKTDDLCLAVTLQTLGFFLIEMESKGYNMYKFVFQNSEDLQELVKKYWLKELLVEPISFWQEMKLLKTRMYQNAN